MTAAARGSKLGPVITISLANAIFVICLLVGGGLLLITVVVGDIVGGLLDFMHLGLDIAGVSLMPLLLGFVSMFGVGGLFGTQVFQLDPGRASLLGGGTGIVGAGLVFVMFNLLQRAEAPQAFSLTDLVGETGHVAVTIPAGRYGSVFLTYAGQSHNLTATADHDIPAGSTVNVIGVAGSNLIVVPAAATGTTGGSVHA